MRYEFRVDKDDRHVPSFSTGTAELLGELVGVRLEEAGSDFLGLSTDIGTSLRRFRDCRGDQCILWLRDADDRLQVSLAMLRASASVVVTFVDPSLLHQESQVEAVRRLLDGCFEAPDSLSIAEHSQESLGVIRSPHVRRHPPARFGTGTEWYQRLSARVWTPHYTAEVMSEAPAARVRRLDDGSFELYGYVSLLDFDAARAAAVLEHFGRHRRPVATPEP